MRRLTTRIRVAGASLLFTLLAACQPGPLPITPKEQAHMKALTDHMTARCFGRYLIEIPSDMKPGKIFAAKFTAFPYPEATDGVDIKVMPMQKVVFDQRLAKRKAELEKRRVMAHPEWSDLKDIVSTPHQDGVIFNRTNGGMSRALRVLELHAWKNDYAITMSTDTFDESFPEDQDDAQLRSMGSDTPQKLAIMQSLYARVRGRHDDQTPTEPGTCIQNGFVSGKVSGELREEVYLDFVSASMPDVMMHIESDSGIHENDTLLDRLAGIKANLASSNGHIVRKGSRISKAGLHFDEVLSTGLTPNDHVMGQLFSLEANSKIGSSETPMLNIDFWNGDREGKPVPDGSTSTYELPEPPPLTKSSLSETESIALWDAITSTLRPRPGAF